MFLRQVRADQQQQTSDFRLRKPKRTRVKSPNISSHVLSSDTTSPFTNININSQIHEKNKTSLQPEDTLHEENRTPLQPEDTLHEENRTPLQPEDTPINENDDFYSIFDNNGNFFNDPNDSDDFYNNSGDDQETNREFNEKVYDGNKKQNHYSRNEAGPYFPNYTMLLLFLWITKHQIGLEAYRDFANIIKHPKFNPKDVPISLATIKKYRDGLPLLPFKGHTVSLNNRNTPSTSKSTGQALIFPLKDILHRILANLQLREHMYFGPGIYCENKCEIWHRELWHKSPLFGEISIRLNNVVYGLGDFITYYDVRTSETYYGRIISILHIDDSQDMCIKIECILEFDSLSSILKSKHRKVASQDGCLWMTDDTLIIKPANIISKVDIWLTDISEPSNFSHFITEIVYYINGRWITRPIDLRHHHPVEYITIQNPPSNLPTYRFFLDIYIDKFGPFRNAYHAIGDIYLQIDNMKQILRQKLKNHFLYGFIPYAAASDEVLQPIIKDIQELEREYELEINNQRVWVTGGLGVITSDLPEGNEQAGVKNHNAYYGCRNCMIHHNNLHDISFDIAKYGRYHHKTTLQFAEVRNAQTQTERDFLTMEYGRTPNNTNITHK
ncbi:unnamed protein product [Rhizophagus irregularis]|nr:unnamed protein product [Rhizophagus irregularis]